MPPYYAAQHRLADHARAWGLPLYLTLLYAACRTLTCAGPIPDEDIRPAIWQGHERLLGSPTLAEARACHSDQHTAGWRPMRRAM